MSGSAVALREPGILLLLSTHGAGCVNDPAFGAARLTRGVERGRNKRSALQAEHPERNKECAVTLREFRDFIVEPNLSDFAANPADLRHATIAVQSVDALVAHMHYASGGTTATTD